MSRLRFDLAMLCAVAATIAAECNANVKSIVAMVKPLQLLPKPSREK